MADRKAKRTPDKQWDNEVPLQKKLDDLYKLIDGIETAMFTTRRADGHLVSRPMQVQERMEGTDLWFMTNIESNKLDELEVSPQVNLSFYKDRTREWVSVSGVALVSRDRKLIHELYKPDWRAWLGDEGGARDGGPDDPRIALIMVEAQSVIYSKKNKPMPLVLFELVKGIATGSQPDVADMRELGRNEIASAAVNAK